MRPRRRAALNVWPAVADLMSVLVVPSLAAAVFLHVRAEESARAARQPAAATPTEAALNQAMFRAIQDAQRLVDRLQSKLPLKAGADQSFRFGEDLVFFERNSVRPVWRGDGAARLRAMCTAITAALELGARSGSRAAVSVVVEGHTDKSACRASPTCNWALSAARAAAFVEHLHDPLACPGGATWRLSASGLAATRPLSGARRAQEHRRIEVRLVPDYGRFLRARSQWDARVE